MTAAPTWTRHQLRSAVWAAHVLGESGARPDEARLSWSHLPLGGAIGFADLDRAQEGLASIGLLHLQGAVLVPDARLAALAVAPGAEAEELLLALILETSPPLWLRTAVTDGDVVNELIPEEANAALQTVFVDPARREALLLALARRFDDAERSAIGALGEEEVVAQCRDELLSLGAVEEAARVQRVSLVSDQLGYDVTAPRLDGTTRRIEVKATRSAGSHAVVFLSRNEATVALRDPDWSLVIVAVTPRLEVDGIIGWMSGAAVGELLPHDGELATWQSAKVRIPRPLLDPGMPPAW